MSAFVLAQIEVNDPQGYEAYRTGVAETIERHGGRIRVRGGEVTALEGDWQSRRVVLVEFDSKNDAMAWWNSAEYEALKPIRRAASEGTILLIEGAPTS